MYYQMALTKSPAIAQRVATVGLMQRLPGLMDAAGISKTGLIELTGINQPTIYALHKGTYESSLSGDNMAAIAQALGVTLSELTGC
jgi:transcriptional regulator with XRE-family HTH domain